MLRNWMKLSMIPALALSLFVAGCENIGGPDGLTGPQTESASPGLLGGLLGGDDDVNHFTVAKEKDVTVGAVTGVIGSGGGKLVLGKHELWVPKDAVSGATVFTMTKLSGELRFSLTATKLLPNDVGSAGFAVPVKLVVSFQDATNVADPSLLRIFWAKPDGTFEQQPTDLDLVGKRGIGHLGHFSDYIMAIP